MKLLVTGGAGYIGSIVSRLLLAGGHEVVGTSRSPDRASGLDRQGVRSAVVDVFDREGLHDLLAAERPEVVIGELSDLPRTLSP
ncbi:MAG: NAD-dependent epimerase/dehydratase family protein, partial [Solirubrobacteraceae bacterium]